MNEDIERLVEETALVDEGYTRRGVYLIKEERGLERRFIAVSHGLYTYDGERPIYEEAER